MKTEESNLVRISINKVFKVKSICTKCPTDLSTFIVIGNSPDEIIVMTDPCPNCIKEAEGSNPPNKDVNCSVLVL